jgi:hypothetical protein
VTRAAPADIRNWWVATSTVGFTISGILGTTIAFLGLGGAVGSPVLTRMLRGAAPTTAG